MEEPIQDNSQSSLCSGCGNSLEIGQDGNVEFCRLCVLVLDDSETPLMPTFWPLPKGSGPGEGLPISGIPPTANEECFPKSRHMVGLLLKVCREIREAPPSLPEQDYSIAMEKWAVKVEKSDDEFGSWRLLTIFILVLFGPLGWVILILMLVFRGKTSKKTVYPYFRIDYARKRPVHLWELRDAPLRNSGCEVLTPGDFQDVTIGFHWNGNHWEGCFGVRVFQTEHLHLEPFNGEKKLFESAESFLREIISFFPYGVKFHWRVSGIKVRTMVGVSVRPVYKPKTEI